MMPSEAVVVIGIMLATTAGIRSTWSP